MGGGGYGRGLQSTRNENYTDKREGTRILTRGGDILMFSKIPDTINICIDIIGIYFDRTRDVMLPDVYLGISRKLRGKSIV